LISAAAPTDKASANLRLGDEFAMLKSVRPFLIVPVMLLARSVLDDFGVSGPYRPFATYLTGLAIVGIFLLADRKEYRWQVFAIWLVLMLSSGLFLLNDDDLKPPYRELVIAGVALSLLGVWIYALKRFRRQ
jgi:hypothetical protein